MLGLFGQKVINGGAPQWGERPPIGGGQWGGAKGFGLPTLLAPTGKYLEGLPGILPFGKGNFLVNFECWGAIGVPQKRWP